MSLQFSDTDNFKGIIQKYEEECGFDAGYISGNTTRRKRFTVEANLALDDFLRIAIPAGGTWQYDDSNHTKYPEIKTDIISGQRDYSFTTDQQGNLILDIYRVFITDSSGVFRDISPVDMQSGADTEGFWDGQNLQGVPTRYDKTANGIFLNPIPNYNYTNGLKLYINREASYFVHTDTTKMPGVPGIFHAYFYLKPSAEYARRKVRKNASRLLADVLRMEEDIKWYFSNRQKDVRHGLRPAIEDNR